MLYNLREQTRYQLKNDIFSFESSLSLVLPFLFCRLSLLHLLLGWLLYYLIQSCSRNINIFDINIGGLLKRINLADCSLDLVRKLMRANALYNFVLMVGEYNVALGIEFKDEVVGEGLTAEAHHDYTLYSNLPHRLHSFRAEMSAETHGEAWRDALFVWFLLSEVKSHTVLDQKLVLLLWFRSLDDIGGGVDIVDVGDSESDENLQLCNHRSDVERCKTYLGFNFIGFIRFGDLLLLHYQRL